MNYGFETLFTDELLEHSSLIRSGVIKISTDETRELEDELEKRGLPGLGRE